MDTAPKAVFEHHNDPDRFNILLQERLYLIDGQGPTWRVRLSPLDRHLSIHTSEKDALKAALRAARRWAPARIRVLHSGRPVAEWYIRYPDGEWLETLAASTADPHSSPSPQSRLVRSNGASTKSRS